MKKQFLFATSLLSILFAMGCAKPDHVATINSPVEGVFYTVETFNGHGAPDSDFTRVYAHLERNGKSDRKLVIDGTYLQLSKILWNSPHDVTLCVTSGITDSFRSQVTLIAGSASETIHNHLQELTGSGTGNCR